MRITLDKDRIAKELIKRKASEKACLSDTLIKSNTPAKQETKPQSQTNGNTQPTPTETQSPSTQENQTPLNEQPQPTADTLPPKGQLNTCGIEPLPQSQDIASIDDNQITDCISTQETITQAQATISNTPIADSAKIPPSIQNDVGMTDGNGNTVTADTPSIQITIDKIDVSKADNGGQDLFSSDIRFNMVFIADDKKPFLNWNVNQTIGELHPNKNLKTIHPLPDFLQALLKIYIND